MILVAGSANLDFVVRAPHIPSPGETVLGRDFKTFPGGKGANQAVACARAGGAPTHMLLALGNDAFATPIEASLTESHVQLHLVRVPEHPTGTAFICVSDDAENATFLEKVKAFDEFMISEAHKIDNNISWLGASRSKPFSREVVESKYFPMLKHSKKDGEISTVYPPFIRISLPTDYKNQKDFSCEFYDKDGTILSASSNAGDSNNPATVIPPGSYCAALMSGTIWTTSNGFGVTWKCAQVKVFPPRGSIPRGKCLVDDPEDDSESESEDEVCDGEE